MCDENGPCSDEIDNLRDALAVLSLFYTKLGYYNGRHKDFTREGETQIVCLPTELTWPNIGAAIRAALEANLNLAYRNVEVRVTDPSNPLLSPQDH